MSGLKKHSLDSLGKDLEMHDFVKHSSRIKGGKIGNDPFFEGTRGLVNIETLVNIGVRAGAGIVGKMIENGINSITNNDKQKVPLITSSGQSTMGKNIESYHQTHSRVETSKR